MNLLNYRNWLKSFINQILPPRCLICGKVTKSPNCLCKDCFENITFISTPYCQHCGKPLHLGILKDLYCSECLSKKDILRMCRAAIKYDDYSKKLILDFKFNDHIENRKLLARWLFMAGKDIFNSGVDLIIPVPLHYFRLYKRKYNQSAMLARELGNICHIDVDYKSLQKIRHTKPQVLCSGIQRSKNIKHAFDVKHPENIKDKRIVLIDDVFTTGATLKECAKVLKKAGAKSIDALTVAKVYTD